MAYTFDGDNDYIAFADNPLLDVGAGDFTLAFWEKSSTEPANNDRLLCKGENSGTGVRYELSYYDNAGEDQLRFTVDDNSSKSVAPSANDGGDFLYDGAWHLIICERDSGTHLKVFKDGNTEVCTSADTTGDIDNAQDLNIMAADSGGGISEFCPGIVAEFALFKRLLSTSEKDGLVNFSAQFYNPDFYTKLIRGTACHIGSLADGAVTGAVVATHPPIIYPAPPLGFHGYVAAAADLNISVHDCITAQEVLH